MDLINAIFLNLVSMIIGAFAAQAYERLRVWRRQRAVRWFWETHRFSKILIFLGQGLPAFADTGELEPTMNVLDALTLVQLRLFLEGHFSNVIVTGSEALIDWSCPVVSLGGPIVNSLTKSIGEGSQMPFRFKGLPYQPGDSREIESMDRADTHKSTFNPNGLLTSDVGFISKTRGQGNREVPVYVIASNYGAGNQGITKLVTSLPKLRQLRKLADESRFFQAVIRSTVDKGEAVSCEVKAVRAMP